MLSGSFRRRLTVAFILIAGVAAGLLGIGTYVVVRTLQLEDFRETTLRQGASSLALLPAGTSARELPGLLSTFEEPDGLEFLVVGDEVLLASQGISAEEEVPSGVRDAASVGEIGVGEAVVDGIRYLVVGGRAGGSGVETYLFFSLAPTLGRLRSLEQVLGVGWVAVLCLAALLGDRVSRRALRPVNAAAGAASAMAQAHLETRLPVSGDDEFAAWAASFNEMADALQAQIDALRRSGARERRFAGDLAHELRTPLGSPVTAASLIEDQLDSLPSSSRMPAELLITEARRLRGLVDELLELFRLDAGQEDQRPVVLSLRRAVSAVLTRYHWEDVVELGGDDRLQVLADPRHLERVVANLVDNAVTHGRVGVRIRLHAVDREAILEVSDQGDGIPAEALPHVFERFYKADTSRSREGSGLGLAIAAQNALLMGGVLSVESEQGPGTTFRLRLPISPDAAPDALATSQSAAACEADHRHPV